jgi:oxygen-independent coproporphyrinogen-3 oxidase
MTAAGGDFGVYVHVPFCARRCDYCAFATWTDRSHLMADYVDACVVELASVERPATSVFFGGGTPSLLPAELLVRVLDAVARVAGAEVTVECNPETVTPAKLAAYRAAGASRVSFGVQSMVPSVLAALGREHDPASVTRAVGWAREAGFESFNLDLIYGGAGESMDDWRRTLDAVVALGPPHVSAYALTVEPGTALAGDPARHPDDDDQADKYVVAERVLAEAGLASYEISNWARPGHECAHNLLYWSQGDYRGVGCAAHSHVDGRRWWNVRTPERYIGLVSSGESPVAAEEVLDAEARRLEGLQLALRMSSGVPAEVLPVAELDGLVEPAAAPGHVRLTVTGRLLANHVALRLELPRTPATARR